MKNDPAGRKDRLVYGLGSKLLFHIFHFWKHFFFGILGGFTSKSRLFEDRGFEDFFFFCMFRIGARCHL